MFEIPFLMIVLSWVLKHRVNRWANIIAATLFIVAQVGSLVSWSPISNVYFLFHNRNRSSVTHRLESLEVAQLGSVTWKACRRSNRNTRNYQR